MYGATPASFPIGEFAEKCFLHCDLKRFHLLALLNNVRAATREYRVASYFQTSLLIGVVSTERVGRQLCFAPFQIVRALSDLKIDWNSEKRASDHAMRNLLVWVEGLEYSGSRDRYRAVQAKFVRAIHLKSISYYAQNCCEKTEPIPDMLRNSPNKKLAPAPTDGQTLWD